MGPQCYVYMYIACLLSLEDQLLSVCRITGLLRGLNPRAIPNETPQLVEVRPYF